MSSISEQFVAVAAATDRIDESGHARGTQVSDGRSRLNPVLDSLASICVRKGKGEVYAVAMQLYEKNDGSGGGGKLTLTIAGNSGVPPQVVSHLESVLSQLRAIASRCYAFHKDRGMTYPLQYDTISPPSHPSILASEPLVADLKASLYRHSIDKFVSRIGKRYVAFLDFMGRLERYMATALDQANDTWKALLNVRALIILIFKGVLPTDFKYEKLVSLLDTLHKKARVVLDSDAVTRWGDAVKRPNEYAFPLARYLEKVVAIHAHCAVLTKYAHSPRLRRHFHSRLHEVRSIPAIITTVPPPADFGKLIEDTLKEHESETADDARLHRIVIKTQQKFFRNDGSVQAPVHCECALVQYFNNPMVASDEMSPMDFLGVSKLSCNACARFIEASNKYSKRNFHTRGCHGKWYFPWALPPSDQQVSSTFQESMSRYIVKLLVWKRAARPRSNSDSSCPSTDLEGVPDENETDESNIVLALGFQRVFGGS